MLILGLFAAFSLGGSFRCVARTPQAHVFAKNGVLTVDVVLPSAPSAVERYAADELSYHLSKAFGSLATIVAEDQLAASSPPYHFFVGRTEAARKAGLPVQELVPDEHLLKSVDNGLCLVGHDSEVVGGEIGSTWLVHSLGTLYAVYDFLETEMGVKWLWPGEVGEVIPRRKSLEIQTIDRRGVEPLEERFWGGAGFWGRAYGFTDMKSLRGFYEKQARFLVRHRVGRRRKINCGHSFNDWWQRFGGTHPEYFNLLPDGTRRPFADPTLVTMCCSNPDVWKQKVSDWRDWWLKRGKANGFEPWVNCCENDSAGLCQCSNCRAWDPPDPQFGQCPYWKGGLTRKDLDDLCRTNTKYSLTWLVGDNRWDIPRNDSNLKPTAPLGDRYANFYNHVLAEARKFVPEAKVIGYAYENYVEAPQMTRVDPGVAIEFVPRSYFPYDRTESEFFRKHWLGWRNAGVGEISYRPNYTLAGGSFLFDQGSLVLEDFAFAYTNGMRRCLFDSLRGAWAAQTLTSYALTRAFRDPLHGYREAHEEMVSAFGSAREAVAEYLDGIREQTTKWTFADVRRMAWNNHTGICGGGSHGNGAAILGDFLDEEFLAKCHRTLDAAVRAAGDDSEVLARIDFLRKGLRDTELTRNTRLAQKRWEADRQNQEKKKSFDDAFKAMNAYRASVENDCVCNFNFEAANERTGLHWPHVCIGGEKD